MPIVTEKNVSDALTFMAQGGASEQEAVFLAAEMKMKRREAEVFLASSGSVEERKMRVRVDEAYCRLWEDTNQAQWEWSQAKARERGAAQICDIWRSENANNRNAERIR